VANPYSIHLVEPLSPEVAQRVAAETASQLGGTPDKLAQLLTRNSGSRIARASSATQADRVASILRKAGVTVQVVDPETTENVDSVTSSVAEKQVTSNTTSIPEQQLKPEPSTEALPTTGNYHVNAGSSNTPSGGMPIVPDEIIPIDEAPYAPPSSPKNPTPVPDPFPALNNSIAPGNDPFSTDSKDLFGADPIPYNPTPTSDPFAAPAIDPYNQPAKNPFTTPTRGAANAPSSDPFAAPANNPFAEPAGNDPFAAPTNNPFATPQTDPFGSIGARDPFAPASGLANPNLETPPIFDPFAQSQAPAVASDLPIQAQKAQNKPLRRSSIYGQMLQSLIVPIILMGVLTGVYLNYQIPITVQRFLMARANTTSSILSAQLITTVANIEGVSLKATLDQLTAETRSAVPNAKFVAIATTANSNKILSNAVDTGIDVQSLNAKLEAQKLPQDAESILELNGSKYVVYAKPIQDAILRNLGVVYTGIDYNVINDEKIRLFVPLFTVLFIIIVVASGIAAAFASRLVRPITAAAEQANRISLGDLDRTVDIQSNDEIGDLLGSLERMRVSLKSVIGRLRRDR
jgi:HAMP domain-containing protein